MEDTAPETDAVTAENLAEKLAEIRAAGKEKRLQIYTKQFADLVRLQTLVYTAVLELPECNATDVVKAGFVEMDRQQDLLLMQAMAEGTEFGEFIRTALEAKHLLPQVTVLH